MMRLTCYARWTLEVTTLGNSDQVSMVSHVMSTLHQDICTRCDGDAVRAGGTGLDNGVSSCHSKSSTSTCYIEAGDHEVPPPISRHIIPCYSAALTGPGRITPGTWLEPRARAGRASHTIVSSREPITAALPLHHYRLKDPATRPI